MHRSTLGRLVVAPSCFAILASVGCHQRIDGAPVEPSRALERSWPSSPDERVITLVDRDANPCSGASISIISCVGDDRTRGELGLLRNVRRCEREGERRQADERGLVRLPPYDVATRLVARCGSLRAIERLDPRASPPASITLVDPPVLRVRVVDADGTPVAGVPVIVASRRHVRSPDLPAAVTLGSDGLACVEDVDLLAAEDGRDAETVVGLDLPDPDRQWIAFDPSVPPRDPIVLHLPPTGRVLVRVAAPALSPTELDGIATLVPDGTGAPARLPSFPISATIAKGSGEFSRVGRGVSFRVVLALRGRPSVEVAYPGLGSDEAERAISMEAPEVGPSLVGRLLDVEKRPLARRHVEISIGSSYADMGWHCTLGADTDDDGRLAVALGSVHLGETNRIHFSIEAEPGVVSGGFDATTPEPVPPVFDLGERIVPETVVWCAGIVVDDEGLPIPGIEVIAFARSPTFPSAVTDGTGRFTLRGEGEYEDATLSARAGASGFADTEDVPFTRGDRNVRIVMSREGDLAGSVLLDAGALAGDVRVLLHGDDSVTSNAVAADGRFGFRSHAPGDYRVTFEAADGSPPTQLAVVEHVRIESGKVIRDPRLQGVDLRGRIVHVELNVRDASSHAPDNVPIYEPARVDRPARRLGWVHSGRASLTLTRPTDLEVRCPGHRTALVSDASGNIEVVLGPPLPVRVRLVPSALPIQVDFVGLRPAPVRDHEWECAGAEFKGAESHRLDVMRPGPHVVSLDIAEQERYDAGGLVLTRHLEVQLAPEDALVTIADSPDEQWIDVRIDDAAVKRTLAAIELARAKGTLVE